MVIGAGITGALVSDALTASGLSVIALDRRQPGSGSTSASTALLQYELDTSLTELTEKVGQARAVDAYRAALHGVRAIGRIARDLDRDVGHRRRPSLYYASQESDSRALLKEGAARQRAKIPCRILRGKEIKDIVDFQAPAALWSTSGGEVDPLRLARALFERCARGQKFDIYGDTEVGALVSNKTAVEVHTDHGVVRASRVVIAAGYEAGKFLPRSIARLNSTYAIATEPVRSFAGWRRRCLIWESARPYLYARTTSDNRIMVGGEDDPFHDPGERDARVASKAKKLLKKAQQLFPRIDMKSAYGWAGTFAETRDGLPYIGPHPDVDNRVFYALAYGANGMPFSALAGELLAAALLGKVHRYRNTFSFDR